MILVLPNMVGTLIHLHLAAQQHASHGTSPFSQVSPPLGLNAGLSWLTSDLTHWCRSLGSVFSHVLLSSPELIKLELLRIRVWPSSLVSPHFCLSGFILSHDIMYHYCWWLRNLYILLRPLSSDFYTPVWWPVWHFHMNVSQLDVAFPKRNSWFPLLSKQILLAGSASSLSSHPSANLAHFISAPLHFLSPPPQPAPSLPCISAVVSNWPPHTHSCFPISHSPHSRVVIKTQKTTPVTLCCKSSGGFLWTLSKIQAPCFSLQGGSCAPYLLFFTHLLLPSGIHIIFVSRTTQIFLISGSLHISLMLLYLETWLGISHSLGCNLPVTSSRKHSLI